MSKQIAHGFFFRARSELEQVGFAQLPGNFIEQRCERKICALLSAGPDDALPKFSCQRARSLGGSRGGNAAWEQTTLPQLTSWIVTFSLAF